MAAAGADSTRSIATLKDEGNAAFAARQYGEAVAAYSAAIELDSQNAVLYSNRSAAFLARSAPGDALLALSDANSCLRLDPTFVKGFSRKAGALLALGQHDEAAVAARQGLRLDAGNAPLRESLAAAQAAKRVAAAQAEATSGHGGDDARSGSDRAGAPASSSLPAAASSVFAAGTAAPAVVQDDPLASFLAEIQEVEAAAKARPRGVEAAAAGAPAPASAAPTNAVAAQAAAALAAEEEDTYEAREAAAAAAASARSGGAASAEGDAAEAAEDDVDAAAAEAEAAGAEETSQQRAAREALSARIAAQDLGSGRQQVERLRGPHAAWLNLNPYEVLALPPEASPEDVRARQRRLGALVHPDKNLWDTEAARAAFDEVRRAAEALADAGRRRAVLTVIAGAYRAARKLWRRQGGGGSGGAAAGPSSAAQASQAALEELRRRETRRAFAEAEQRKRGHEARVKAEARREAEQEAAEEDEAAAERAADAAWAAGREGRAEHWASFRAVKRRRLGDGELHLNEVARYGAGKFADQLGAGATGDVTRTRRPGGGEGEGGGGSGDLDASEAADGHRGGAGSSASAGAGGRPGAGVVLPGDEYKRRWR